MQPSTAKVFVTKLAAARRLLRAAIRMYFHREDALAVHAVAAAAYGILKDLKDRRNPKAARGESEARFASETLMQGFLAMARERVRGTLQPEVLSDSYMLRFLDDLIAHLNIGPNTDLKQIKFAAVLDSTAIADYWRSTNRASNFLKHANQDGDAALPLSEVDNYGLLMKGMLSYESVAPNDLGFEGVVLQVYFLASRDQPLAPDNLLSAAVAKVRAMGLDERLTFSAYQLDRERPPGID